MSHVALEKKQQTVLTFKPAPAGAASRTVPGVEAKAAAHPAAQEEDAAPRNVHNTGLSGPVPGANTARSAQQVSEGNAAQHTGSSCLPENNDARNAQQTAGEKAAPRTHHTGLSGTAHVANNKRSRGENPSLDDAVSPDHRRADISNSELMAFLETMRADSAAEASNIRNDLLIIGEQLSCHDKQIHTNEQFLCYPPTPLTLAKFKILN